MKLFYILTFILVAQFNSYGQLQSAIVTGNSNNQGSSTIEVCYQINNTSANDITLKADMENKISVLYGQAPLNGYFTRGSECIDHADWTLNSIHPSINQADLVADVLVDKILGLQFSPSSDIMVASNANVQLFCISWNLLTPTCDDFVYWMFCDDDVADTYYNDFQIFPLGSACGEGSF